ncbi:uncharacterized protein LOC129915242 isoform X2 [Episyrphus balteatus]|uniref:uncharacterized protein LOC129915242 isoform X2 n=1 Tax=Episyrphus balteatus TaxID=286459 RepID=UPI00248577EB|nr:uncharacterized protein LOC129915242 isoform X2 [Episyrphus balteatus]
MHRTIKIQECKILWKGLRSSYARHLQFMRQNEQDPKRKPRKPWYLADHMSFLEKYIQVKSKDRLYYKTTKNPNIDDNDNSTSFSNIEYKSENRTMDESSIKSEELSFRSEVNEEPNTLMKRRESYEENNEELTNMMEYLVRESETENSSSVEKSRIKSSDEDGNETQPAKRIKMNTRTVSILNANKKTIPPREESFLRFLQSLLLDIGKLSNRNLRLFKEDVLKDMNKYLDEQEYSTRVRLFA